MRLLQGKLIQKCVRDSIDLMQNIIMHVMIFCMYDTLGGFRDILYYLR